MRKIFLLLFMCCLFQAKAQFKYGDLSEKQKQQISSIETVYKKALEGQTADFLYKDYMLKISLDGDMCQLPLVDIENISVEETNGSYLLKLRHMGGWEYKGFYKMQNQAKAETVKAKLQQFLDDFEPFNSNFLAELCDNVRDLERFENDDNFYDFEYKLLRLVGIKDIDNTSDGDLKTHSKDFQCPVATNIYPKGNYLRQIKAIASYTSTAIQRFKKYRAILLKYGAKTSNEICGCKSC